MVPDTKDAVGCSAEIEAKQLIALCRAGRLYEVEQWINEGGRSTFPPQQDAVVREICSKLPWRQDSTAWSSCWRNAAATSSQRTLL